MNLRDLRYICAVADHRHFGKAAEAVHASQPTLSGQILKLEDSLGVALFERTTKSVRLTPVGERIVAIARDMLQSADRIETIAQTFRDPTALPLRLGIIPTIAPYIIPLFVDRMAREQPTLKPKFVEDITDSLMRRLDQGDLDAVILATDPGGAQLKSLPLYDEPFWFACPRGHALEQNDSIDLSDLDPEELLLLTDGHCFRDQALAVCGLDTSGTGADTTATSLETIVNLVGAGHGVTLIPAVAMKGAWTTDLGVITRPLNNLDATRTVRLVYRSGFPREALLHRTADVIAACLPNTVRRLR